MSTRGAAPRLDRSGRIGPIALGLVATVFVLALGATGLLAQRTLADEPRLCLRACHADGISTSRDQTKHPSLGCTECHPVSALRRLELAFLAATGPRAAARPHGTADASSCVRCHETRPEPALRLALGSSGHRTHASGAAATGCIGCHGATEHKSGTAAGSCTGCHPEDRLHRPDTVRAALAQGPEPGQDLALRDPDGCVHCHAFATGLGRPAEPTAAACNRCHGPRAPTPLETMLGPDALHGKSDCRLCHNPHGTDRSTEQGGHRCASCHDAMPSSRPTALLGHRACESCHSAHAPLREATGSCRACHPNIVAQASSPGGASHLAAVPPGPPLLAARSDVTVAAADAGVPMALKHDACSSCHLPHDWVADRAGCVECHDETAGKLAGAGEKHSQCASCHLSHATSTAAATCAPCHAPEARGSEEASPTHQSCIACHAPHASSKQQVTGCAECHAAAARELATTELPTHRGLPCGRCHATHGNPLSGARACAGADCHAAEIAAVASAGRREHQRCSACHAPHVFPKGAKGGGCANCHADKGAASAAHRGDCKQCHAAHGPSTVSQAACLGCHPTIKPRATGQKVHASCGSCHGGHTAAKAAADTCPRCHRGQTEAMASWPVGSEHRGPCSKCHATHEPRLQATCESCHEPQATAERGRKHRCTQCHDAHRVPPSDRAKLWQDCNRCHGAAAAAAAARGPTHARCASCHSAHGFRSAGCTAGSCHGDIFSLGAHASPSHRECLKCHDAHAAGTVSPQQCTAGCHQELVNHWPSSPRCQACHPFQ